MQSGTAPPSAGVNGPPGSVAPSYPSGPMPPFGMMPPPGFVPPGAGMPPPFAVPMQGMAPPPGFGVPPYGAPAGNCTILVNIETKYINYSIFSNQVFTPLDYPCKG